MGTGNVGYKKLFSNSAAEAPDTQKIDKKRNTCLIRVGGKRKAGVPTLSLVGNCPPGFNGFASRKAPLPTERSIKTAIKALSQAKAYLVDVAQFVPPVVQTQVFASGVLEVGGEIYGGKPQAVKIVGLVKAQVKIFGQS